jgi:hypothetical protein
MTSIPPAMTTDSFVLRVNTSMPESSLMRRGVGSEALSANGGAIIFVSLPAACENQEIEPVPYRGIPYRQAGAGCYT